MRPSTPRQPESGDRTVVPYIDLAGIRVDAVTEADCVRLIHASLDGGYGGWIVTPNLDHFARMRRDSGLRKLYSRADLCVADGMPLVWASKVQLTPLPQRVAGSDLIWSLSESAAEAGRSVFFLGGDPGTAERAASALTTKHPGLRVVGTSCPQIGGSVEDADLTEIREQLKASGADIIFVALGSPKQEVLIERVRDALPQAWWIGVGISFSFVSGDIQRAPAWMQRSGLEWIHRLSQEPRRLAHRYLVRGVPFAIRMLAGSLRRRVRRRPDGDVEVVVERVAAPTWRQPAIWLPGKSRPRVG